ncbi:MAG: hypothetical protein ACI4U3_01495 [Traorella sp.]
MINVEMVKCDSQSLQFKDENNIYDIDFFNVHFIDENRTQACEYLTKQQNIQLEKEPLAQNAYYIYIDEKLFQEILLEKEWAKVNLNYPEYLHQIKTEHVRVNAFVSMVSIKNHSFFILSGLFILVLLCFVIYNWL